MIENTEKKTECKVCIFLESQVKSLTDHNLKLIRDAEFAWIREQSLYQRIIELMKEIDRMRDEDNYR